MAVKLRLKRMVAKKSPFYRIVAADSRMPRDGRFIEQLGTYDPRQNPAKVSLKKEEILKWLGNGAQPSDTVKNILSREGVIKEFAESKKDYVKALQDICLELVNYRDKLEVREMPSLDDNAIVLYVYASHDDISKLIGRKGVMANSIRQLMSVSTRGMHKRLDIKFESYGEE